METPGITSLFSRKSSTGAKKGCIASYKLIWKILLSIAVTNGFCSGRLLVLFRVRQSRLMLLLTTYGRSARYLSFLRHYCSFFAAPSIVNRKTKFFTVCLNSGCLVRSRLFIDVHENKFPEKRALNVIPAASLLRLTLDDEMTVSVLRCPFKNPNLVLILQFNYLLRPNVAYREVALAVRYIFRH